MSGSIPRGASLVAALVCAGCGEPTEEVATIDSASVQVASPADSVAATTWDASDGLVGPIYDVTTDEGGNVWAINPTNLFLLTPGASQFVAFGNADGLHVEPFTAADGSAQTTRLTALAGATPNRVYLGYYGYESNDPFGDTDAQKALGNGDRVDYDPATGRIAVNRYQFRCTFDKSHCWEDRSVRRIIVGHSGAAAGHAFFGFNHGTAHVANDVIGDHVHPEIIWHNGTSTVTRYGECQALALNDDGTLWIGNRYGVGMMNWNPDPIGWLTAKFRIAFTTYTDNHALDVPWGYVEDNRGAAIAPDGTVWLVSDNLGLTSWNPATKLSTMRHWAGTPGVPTTGLVDVAADVDGTIWLVTQSRALLHLDPATAAVTVDPLQGARRLYLDKTVTPRVLYVAHNGGVAMR